ncbi:hypothetical protein F2Q68_00013856 [Brassica cretica]|uniref:Uncharacterized protein n=1 Tax=Brassica cretica TaxID=69181 RepID=A0A8S9HG77_BRACR|nr:hypothetical protein F2Q68_00013856 [Brassica cretica]
MSRVIPHLLTIHSFHSSSRSVIAFSVLAYWPCPQDMLQDTLNLDKYSSCRPAVALLLSSPFSIIFYVVSLRSWYIKSHSASLDDPFTPFQFQKCHRLLDSYQTPGQSHPSHFGRINLVSEPLWLDDWTSREIESGFNPTTRHFYPLRIAFEKKIQTIFGDKKQFVSNEFDVVQKRRKKQNMYDDEKWLRSGDRRFTKTKRSSRDVIDQNEIQTYASLENMLHKAIHAVRQLKKKGNTYTSSAPKQQCKSSYLSNSDLKTNKISFNKSKAVKSISKVFSTRCFKCHRVGHYAKHKPLVTLENVETEPEKELISTKVRSSDHTDQTDRAVPRTSRLKLRQEPRPDDQIPRTGACLSLTVLHSKINGQDKTEFERVDFKIDRATSSLASLDCTGSHTGPVRRTCFKIH